MSRPSARDAILDAAQRIAAERGVSRITLEEVARESGLSKGGLLYHFPGKEALIQGMLERLISHTSAVREANEQALVGERHRTLRSLLATRSSDEVLNPHVVTAVLAAAAEQPALLDPLREHIAGVRQQIIHEAGDDPLYWLLWAAADGLLLQEVLGIAPHPAEQRDRVHQRLLDLAEELLQ
ncbi:MAG: TetR/AcrR family transcriptional regulator [Gammaproteobacteria bacterium HGW-Gammaproteobacteria-14]|nr:MAG: TetR/AcrR family transcriptional regulator [Gammaproteobacteria bacterium HGW-Gammaproteobacteria-14]